MPSYGSSVINKSSKKVAPKGLVQRRRPAAPVDNGTLPSTNTQSPAADEIVPEATTQSTPPPLDDSQIAVLLPSPPQTQAKHPNEDTSQNDDQNQTESQQSDRIRTTRLRQNKRKASAPSGSAEELNAQTTAKRIRTESTDASPSRPVGQQESAQRPQTESSPNVRPPTLAEYLLADKQKNAIQKSTDKGVDGNILKDATSPRVEAMQIPTTHTINNATGIAIDVTREQAAESSPQTQSTAKNVPSRKSLRTRQRNVPDKTKEFAKSTNQDQLQDQSQDQNQPQEHSQQEQAEQHVEPSTTSIAIDETPQYAENGNTEDGIVEPSTSTRKRKRQTKKQQSNIREDSSRETSLNKPTTARKRQKRGEAISDTPVGGVKSVKNPQQSQEVIEEAGTKESSVAINKRRKPRKPRSVPRTGEVATQESQIEISLIAPTENAVEPSNNGTNDEEGAQEDPEEAQGSPKKQKQKRAMTPPDAEKHEIDAAKTTMFDLCRDRRRGKKSKLESEMQNIDWTEVVRRRKEAEALARANSKKNGDSAREQQEQNRELAAPIGPQLQLRDGQIVLETSSLVVHTRALPNTNEVAIEESDLTKRVNSQSWLFENKRDPSERFYIRSKKWDHDEDEIFYGALRMFGTDFEMISRMFPNRTRGMIKRKFVREERNNEDRIRRTLLGKPDPINLEVYCQATDQSLDDYKDPEVINKELQEAEQRQREEIEREKIEQAEQQKKRQEAARAKTEAANRRKAGEKVPRKKRKKKDGTGAEGQPDSEARSGPEEAEVSTGVNQTSKSETPKKPAKTTRAKRQSEPKKASKPRSKKNTSTTDPELEPVAAGTMETNTMDGDQASSNAQNSEETISGNGDVNESAQSIEA